MGGVNDLFGIQRQLWPEQKLFEQGSIANRRRKKGRGQEITQDARLPLLTDGLGDLGNECTLTDAFGFDSGPALRPRLESCSSADYPCLCSVAAAAAAAAATIIIAIADL